MALTPRESTTDQRHHLWSHSVLRRDFRVPTRVCADRGDLLHSQLRSTVPCTLCATSFGDSITLVVVSRPQKQVLRIDTGRIVTDMAHHHPHGEVTMVQRPRITMGEHRVVLGRPEHSICEDTASFPACPVPTFARIRFGYSCEESFTRTSCLEHHAYTVSKSGGVYHRDHR